MKSFMKVVLMAVALASTIGCSKVPAGNVGINEELYLFPTFEQNPKYSTGENDSGAPFNFQTKEGMTCEADFSVTYNINNSDAALVFQRYRLGIDEINKGPLRNIVRDALNEVASGLAVESVYGEGKVQMVDSVQKLVTERAKLAGISVTQVSLLGSIRLPPAMVAALNSKIEATQRAQQRENELREAEAQAKKTVAEAEGESRKQVALATGRAEATTVEAQAQAKANRILSESLTPALIEYRKIDKWNGALPQFGGGAVPLISIGAKP